MVKKKKTIKVRIALAVDPDGQWNASGWATRRATAKNKERIEDVDPEILMSTAVDGVSGGETRYWLEAEVEVPQVETIKAKVTSAE